MTDMFAALIHQTASVDTPILFASANHGQVLLANSVKRQAAIIPAKQAALGKLPSHWIRIPPEVIGVVAYQKGFLMCASGGSLTYLVSGKAPIRFAPNTPKSMPQLPLQRFWIDKQGRPTYHTNLGGDSSEWGIAQFVNHKWQIHSGDGIPIIDPTPDWPLIGHDRMEIPLGNGRYLDVTARMRDTIYNFQIASADPSRSVFVFNESGEGGSHVVIVRHGKANFFQTDHIEAGYNGLSLLVAPDRIVSYYFNGLDIFRLRPAGKKTLH